jgi:alpha-tubulin suppressor-like RCC1 family protein
MRSLSARATARAFHSLALGALVAGASGCHGEDSVTPPRSGSPPEGGGTFPQVGAVVIKEPATALAQMQATPLTVTLVSTTGQSLGPQPVRWSSLDTRFASVDSLGVVMPLKPGRARIVAAAGAVADTIELTIHVRWLDLALSNSWSAACGIAADSTAYCWGAKLASTDTGSSQSPVEVAGGHHFGAIDVSSTAACAIDGSGRVFCWGANDWGQLGDGSRITSSVPVLVQGVTGATLIGAGNGYACAATSDGTIFCWGHDDFGQIGDGTDGTNLVRPPTRVDGVPRPSKLTLGGLHACALAVDGASYCWGLTQWGLLGAATDPSLYTSTPIRAAGTLQFRDVAASDYVTCGAASTGGVYCWGLYAGSSSTPQLQPGTTSFTSVVVSTIGGGPHTCALDASGVSCWGSKVSLGYGGPITVSIPTPIHIAGSESFVRISAAISATCALARGGEAFCWGQNFLGVLGNGDSADTPTPTLVADPIS